MVAVAALVVMVISVMLLVIFLVIFLVVVEVEVDNPLRAQSETQYQQQDDLSVDIEDALKPKDFEKVEHGVQRAAAQMESVEREQKALVLSAMQARGCDLAALLLANVRTVNLHCFSITAMRSASSEISGFESLIQCLLHLTRTDHPSEACSFYSPKQSPGLERF